LNAIRIAYRPRLHFVRARGRSEHMRRMDRARRSEYRAEPLGSVVKDTRETESGSNRFSIQPRAPRRDRTASVFVQHRSHGRAHAKDQ
jgi:hypothetical protein